VARAAVGRLEARDRFRGAAHFGMKPNFFAGPASLCTLGRGHKARITFSVAHSAARVALLTQEAGPGLGAGSAPTQGTV